MPVSIDVVEQKDIRDGQLAQSLSESLIRVPGISAQNRNQMAQDTQIQTRGFGARSAFGVRGIRLYVDGISLSNPDGISNPGNIDLSTLKSIEVFRCAEFCHRFELLFQAAAAVLHFEPFF